MKYITIITIFLFPFISHAKPIISEQIKLEETNVVSGSSDIQNEEVKYTISMNDGYGEEVEVSNCGEYIKYSLKNYHVRETHYDISMKGYYFECSLIYGENLSEKERKQVIKEIYNNTLGVPLPPFMKNKTPKELGLVFNDVDNKIEGEVVSSGRSEGIGRDNTYALISIGRKISENFYLVFITVENSISTYISQNEYIFNTETKKYKPFYEFLGTSNSTLKR